MMKWLPLFLLVCTTALVSAQSPDPAALVGTWQVDLTPKPGAEPYFQKLVITEVNDSTFTSTFYYDSEIQEARFNADWGALTIAFFTADGSGPYNTAARLEGDLLKGTTHSIGRDFVALWTARKVK